MNRSTARNRHHHSSRWTRLKNKPSLNTSLPLSRFTSTGRTKNPGGAPAESHIRLHTRREDYSFFARQQLTGTASAILAFFPPCKGKKRMNLARLSRDIL